MEKKIKIHKVESKHENDCWCVAISLFMNKPYDDVYNDLKHLLMKDGGLSSNIIKGYLLTKGYTNYQFEDDLYSILQILDTRKGIILDVESKDTSHAVYVKNMELYETIKDTELLWYLERYKVVGFYVNIDKGVKLI
jgi:hypothetical protein